MSNMVTQPTINPTNKLTAATIAAALVSFSGLVVRNLAPTWYDEAVWASLTPLLIFVVGWFVPDQPNVVVVMEEQKEE